MSETQQEEEQQHQAPVAVAVEVPVALPHSHPQVNIVSIDIGIKNLAVCYFAYVHATSTLVVRHWKVHALADKGTERDLDVIGRALYAAFDAIFECLPPPDHYIIENQPALKNPTMKSVQMLTFSYITAKKSWASWKTQPHFMSATEKLKGYPGIQAADYKQRKKAAVEITKELVSNCLELKTTLASAGKKQDDLCDCLLQGIAFVRKLHPVPKVSARAPAPVPPAPLASPTLIACFSAAQCV